MLESLKQFFGVTNKVEEKSDREKKLEKFKIKVEFYKEEGFWK